MKSRAETKIEQRMYKQFTRGVKKRDGYMCQWPGCKSKKRVQAHHILRWADAPLLRHHINNGITLCYQHHKFIWGKEELYAFYLTKILLNKTKYGK